MTIVKATINQMLFFLPVYVANLNDIKVSIYLYMLNFILVQNI